MWWVRARQEATHNEASDMGWWGNDDRNSGICYLEYLFDFCMGMMINNNKRQYHTSTPHTPSTPPCPPCRTGSGRTARATPRRGRRPRGGYTPGPPGQTPSRSRRRNSTWGQQLSLMSVFCSFLKPRLHLIPYPISEREIVHFKPALLKALKDPSS